VVYLLNLVPSELHIFVRPEIQSLQDLAGKKVKLVKSGVVRVMELQEQGWSYVKP
jgi:intracellular sulfur oxidation DsrE/DsrF family protein